MEIFKSPWLWQKIVCSGLKVRNTKKPFWDFQVCKSSKRKKHTPFYRIKIVSNSIHKSSKLTIRNNSRIVSSSVTSLERIWNHWKIPFKLNFIFRLSVFNLNFIFNHWSKQSINAGFLECSESAFGTAYPWTWTAPIFGHVPKIDDYWLGDV